MSLSSVYAVIIAIEDYGLGPAWELNGPCNDAVAVARWLVRVGVVPANIRVLASPMLVNAKAFENGISQLGLPAPVVKADSGQVARLFQATLPNELSCPDLCDGLLMVYWTGHGLFDSKRYPPQRSVFCSDLTNRVAPALPIEDTVRWLRSQLPHLRLVLVIDACALQKESLNVQDALIAVPLPASEMSGNERPYLALYSCSEGEASINVGKGLFTSALLTELSDFKPTTLDEFQKLEGVIRATRERVASQSDGRQHVKDEHFVGWSGRVESRLNHAVLGQKFEELDSSVALLCDRDKQWGCFKGLAHTQFSSLANRVVIAVTHGSPSQRPDAFYRKMAHRFQQEKDDFACSENVVEHRIDLGLNAHVKPEWLHAAFRRSMLRCLSIPSAPEDDGKEQLFAIANYINNHEGVTIFTAHVQAHRLQEEETLFKELCKFWRSLPTIKGRSLVVFSLFIGYDENKWPGWLRWLPTIKDQKALVKQRVAQQGQYLVEPEFTSINRDHLYMWRSDMASLNRRWRPLTEYELDRVCREGETKAMGKAVDDLEAVLHDRIRSSTKNT